MKYRINTIVGIHFTISEIADTGYSVKVLQTVPLSDEELEKGTPEQTNEWIEKNNKLMQSICDFLNQNEPIR